MTHRLLQIRIVTAAVLAATAVGAASWLHAQAPAPRGSAEQLATLAARPTPRLADGHPDLNGTWDHLGGIEFVRPQTLANGSVCVVGCAPPAGAPAGNRGAAAGRPAVAPAANPGTAFPKYKQEFLAKVKDLSDRQVQTDTVLQCHSPGLPRIGPPGKIIQTARELVMLYDDVNGAFFRIVPTDGRPHRKGIGDSYLGDAIGRWDGDTLVVESTNFNDETWLTDNGAFHTKDLKVIERFLRVGDTVQYQAVAEDPAILSEPWTMRPQTLWIAAQEMEEPARCDDRDLDHVVDGSHHDNPR